MRTLPEGESNADQLRKNQVIPDFGHGWECAEYRSFFASLTLMLLVANLADTK